MKPYHATSVVTLYQGDALDVLRSMPDESVHCVITSPPYYGLRDYGATGQLGLEATLVEYLERLCGVFDEVRRVLRADGVCWVNLGDSYASDLKGSDGATAKQLTNAGSYHNHARKLNHGLKPKDLMLVPQRFAIEMQRRGWWVRSDVIWSKPNPMPESVTDRPTRSHEYVWLLSKSARYWYDADAVREPVSENWKHGGGAPMPKLGPHVLTEGKRGHQVQRVYEVAKGANRRSVWTLTPQPTPLAHFATFPEELVETCLKAGTSEHGVCPACGAPWTRVVERTTATPGQRPGYLLGTGMRHDAERAGHFVDMASRTLGWQPSCTCDAGAPVPATVLDPFVGSGTTCRVAQRLGRKSIGIDLNAEYLDMAIGRTAQQALWFSEAAS